jgi:hypothetical protein
MNKGNRSDIDDLKKAIKDLYHYKASHLKEVALIEKYGPSTVWRGIVHIFKITGHPETDICYAWSSPIDGSKKRRYYSVLKIPPIDSPEKAVRATIVQMYKKARSKREGASPDEKNSD